MSTFYSKHLPPSTTPVQSSSGYNKLGEENSTIALIAGNAELCCPSYLDARFHILYKEPSVINEHIFKKIMKYNYIKSCAQEQNSCVSMQYCNLHNYLMDKKIKSIHIVTIQLKLLKSTDFRVLNKSITLHEQKNNHTIYKSFNKDGDFKGADGREEMKPRKITKIHNFII